MKVKTCIFHPWLHPHCTVQTEQSCQLFPLVPLSMISTIFLCFIFLFVFSHSCHAVHLQWNRNAEMQRAELREREKREADALFFIADKVTFPWALRRTLWTIGWMGKLFVRYRNMAGRWRRCLFSFKARARSPKVKGVEKVWLINCSTKVLDELACECVVELHSVEEHDGCFPHIICIWDWIEGFVVHFQVHLSWWNTPQK